VNIQIFPEIDQFCAKILFTWNPGNQYPQGYAAQPPMPHLVGVGLRFVAVLIDGILLMIVGYLLSLVFGGSKSSGFELQGPGAFLWFAVGFAYYIFFEGTRGATPGKMALGMRVIKEDGSPCDMKAAVVRTLLRIVDGLLFYLVAAILVWTSDRKQRLGDRIAGTLVVKG